MAYNRWMTEDCKIFDKIALASVPGILEKDILKIVSVLYTN